MIRVTYFIVCLLLGITLVSCIRDEAVECRSGYIDLYSAGRYLET